MSSPHGEARTITVVLFGMPRGAAGAAESIQANMVQPCRDAGYRVRILSSFDDVGVMDNPRAGETGVVIPYDSYFAFGADTTLVNRQDHADVAELREVCAQYRDIYKNDYASVRNILHQISTLQRAWRYLEATGARSDLYMFLRPDLIFHDRLEIERLADPVLESGGIALPFWHAWNGVNDRLSLASRPAAEALANRVDLVAEFCAFRGLFQPEQLLKFALRKADIPILDIGVTASRIRATGKGKPEDFTVAMYKPEP